MKKVVLLLIMLDYFTGLKGAGVVINPVVTSCGFKSWTTAPPATMTIGQTLVLSASGIYYVGTHSNSCSYVNFVSSDTTVAEVIGNVLTVVGAGTTVITAKGYSTSGIAVTVPQLSQAISFAQSLPAAAAA